MIKVESVYEVVSNVEVVEHRRLMTTWFFVRLKPNKYKKIKCMAGCWIIPIMLPFVGWEKNDKTLIFGDDDKHLDFITSEIPAENK